MPSNRYALSLQVFSCPAAPVAPAGPAATGGAVDRLRLGTLGRVGGRAASAKRAGGTSGGSDGRLTVRPAIRERTRIRSREGQWRGGLGDRGQPGQPDDPLIANGHDGHQAGLLEPIRGAAAEEDLRARLGPGLAVLGGSKTIGKSVTLSSRYAASNRPESSNDGARSSASAKAGLAQRYDSWAASPVTSAKGKFSIGSLSGPYGARISMRGHARPR